MPIIKAFGIGFILLGLAYILEYLKKGNRLDLRTR